MAKTRFLKQLSHNIVGLFAGELGGDVERSKELARKILKEHDSLGEDALKTLHRGAKLLFDPTAPLAAQLRRFAETSLPLRSLPELYDFVLGHARPPLVERPIEALHSRIKQACSRQKGCPNPGTISAELRFGEYRFMLNAGSPFMWWGEDLWRRRGAAGFKSVLDFCTSLLQRLVMTFHMVSSMV